MSDPSWAPARRLSGDYDDDDGRVIDSLVTTEAAPPDPFPAAAVEIPPPSKPAKRPTRLLTGFVTLDANSGLQPFLIAPEDLERVGLTIRVKRTNNTTAANLFVVVAEEKGRMTLNRADGTVPNFGEGCRVYEGSSFDGGDHTGALWVALGQTLTTDTLVVTWAIVTGECE